MEPHAHHWMIPPPSGNPTATAICKVCGDTRVVSISWTPEMATWQRSKSIRLNREKKLP